MIALALVLAAVEEGAGVHTWRQPTDTVRRYLAFLAGNGYTLSDVEKLAAADPSRTRRRRTTETAGGDAAA